MFAESVIKIDENYLYAVLFYLNKSVVNCNLNVILFCLDKSVVNCEYKFLLGSL
jgi:hypothetical protein